MSRYAYSNNCLKDVNTGTGESAVAVMASQNDVSFVTKYGALLLLITFCTVSYTHLTLPTICSV